MLQSLDACQRAFPFLQKVDSVDWEDDWVPPVHEKSLEEKQQLKEATWMHVFYKTLSYVVLRRITQYYVVLRSST